MATIRRLNQCQLIIGFSQISVIIRDMVGGFLKGPKSTTWSWTNNMQRMGVSIRTDVWRPWYRVGMSQGPRDSPETSTLQADENSWLPPDGWSSNFLLRTPGEAVRGHIRQISSSSETKTKRSAIQILGWQSLRKDITQNWLQAWRFWGLPALSRPVITCYWYQINGRNAPTVTPRYTGSVNKVLENTGHVWTPRRSLQVINRWYQLTSFGEGVPVCVTLSILHYWQSEIRTSH